MPSKRLKDETAAAVDRISNLPEPILSHIVSFLPTKAAAATCILSSCWRYVFAASPSLNFDDSCFSGEFKPRTEEMDAEKKQSFVDFVYNVLGSRKAAGIERFRLWCGGRSYGSTHLDNWISTALSHNLRELNLLLAADSYRFSHAALFNCKSLVVLKLALNCKTEVPNAVCLPNLKVLRLLFTKFDNAESAARLISACIVLEELLVWTVILLHGIVIKIVNPALKRLTMRALPRYGVIFSRYVIELDAPSLECLNYHVPVARKYILKNLKSLVRADIRFMEPVVESVGRAGELLVGVSEVQSLYLSGCCMRGLVKCCLLTFANLTHLEIASPHNFSVTVLQSLLERCPILRALILEKMDCIHNNEDGFPEYDNENALSQYKNEDCFSKHGNEDSLPKYDNEDGSPKDVPGCLSCHLREVQLRKFTGMKDELNLVQYILQSANVLEKISIYFGNQEVESSILKELLWHPRASKTCRIRI